jgi:hypothetical protein
VSASLVIVTLRFSTPWLSVGAGDGVKDIVRLDGMRRCGELDL